MALMLPWLEPNLSRKGLVHEGIVAYQTKVAKSWPWLPVASSRPGQPNVPTAALAGTQSRQEGSGS